MSGRTVQLKVVNVRGVDEDFQPSFSVAEYLDPTVVVTFILDTLHREGLPPMNEDGSMTFDVGGDLVRVVADRIPGCDAPTWVVTSFEDAGAARHVVGFMDLTRQVKQ